MILHFVGSYVLGFLPMLGGLVWTIVQLTKSNARVRGGAREFVTCQIPTIDRH
jgi:hypothetical protein